jgi:D-galactarolactone cycloisomerase
MKIKEIHGYELSFTLPEPIGNSLGYFDRRSALVVQVVTDTGHSGWGETSAPQKPAAAFIRSQLAPLLLGQPAAAIGVVTACEIAW